MIDKSILDGLLKFEWWLIDRENDDEYVRVKDVEARLAAQPAKSEWISVEDRLPDERVGVLITDGTDITCAFLIDGKWHPSCVGGADKYIPFGPATTHWKQTPPLPK